MEVIEHIPPADLQTFLQGVKNRLSDGGVVLCTAPSVNLPLEAKHYQHFTVEKLRDCFCQAGFHIQHVEMIHGESLLFRVIARRLLVNRFWICNHPPTQNALFKFYGKHYLRNQDQDIGLGIFAIAVRA
jgi:hypothetical protein